MKWILAIVCLVVFSGCQRKPTKEVEAAAPEIILELQPADCTFPKSFTTKEEVVQGINCVETNLEKAFASLKTSVEGELSIAELKKLQRAGLFEIEVGDDSQWNGIGGVLSLIHPEGKTAISRTGIKSFLAWLRTRSEELAHLADSRHHQGNVAPVDYTLYQDMAVLSEEVINFISDKGSLSLEQAQALLGFAQSNVASVRSNEISPKLRAVWNLKALILESTRADDDIRGSALKHFLKMAVQIASSAKKTYSWWDLDFHPASTPDDIEIEWQRALDLAKTYFRDTTTIDLNADAIKAELRVLMPEADLAERIPDLIKASRKLLEKNGDTHQGLVYGILHLFNGADKAAADIRTSSRHFADCEKAFPCSRSLREAKEIEPLNRVSFISSSDWNQKPFYDPNAQRTILPPRLDGRLEWKTALSRFGERALIENLFNAFDRDGNSLIPVSGETDDLKEATDIAYTILGILSTKAADDAAPLYVRPSTIIAAIGLLGDEWLTNANRDGRIDPSEFYAVVKLFQDITSVSQTNTLSLPLYSKEKLTAEQKLPSANDEFFIERPEFIKNIATAFRSELPYLIPVFEHLDKHNGGAKSVLNVISPKQTKSITAFEFGTQNSKELTDYMSRADILGPAAILVLLDRLVVRCDTNEDEHFNWTELNCVTPLVLAAGDQILSSDLFQLPLGVSDAAKIAMKVLPTKGLPITIAQVTLMNGSVSKFHLKNEFVQYAKNRTRANKIQLAAMFQALSSKSEAQLVSDFDWAIFGGAGFFEKEVKGPEAWDNVFKLTLNKGIIPQVETDSLGWITPDVFKTQWSKLGTEKAYARFAALKEIIPLAFVLGSRPADGNQVFNWEPGQNPTKIDPISPANLLSVLESLISE